MSDFLDYISALRRQVPEVERIGDEAKAQGDLATVRNAQSLLAQWALMISRFTPANDIAPLLETPVRAAAPVPHRAGTISAATAVANRQVGAWWLAFRDGRTPWYVKAIVAVACFLAISPVDFTPDIIPHLGYFDDPVIMIVGIAFAARLVSPLLLAERRDHADSIGAERVMRGSYAFYSVSLAALLATALHMWRPVI